jgi:hypothetical protein
MRARRFCCTSDFSGRWLRLILLGALVAAGVPATAQVGGAGTVVNPTHDDFVAMNGAPVSADDGTAVMAGDEAEALPEAPQPQQQDQKPDNKPLVAATPKMVSVNTTMPIAPIYSKYIPAGYAVHQIHGREKLILGVRDLYSAGNVGDWFLAAGWSQLTNGQPNYGTDRGAFGERLGASAIRETSEGILTDGVFCVMLHEDPRYFVQGPKFSLVHRTMYAITRPLVTRSSNDGHAKPNYALWLGLASGTALNNLYYPKSNRNFHDNLSSFGGSIGGSALGYAVDEYMDQMLRLVHMKHGNAGE